MQNYNPQTPHFPQIRRLHKTQEELSAPIKALTIKVYGTYTCRGDTRKEVIQRDFEEEIIVPEGFHPGHVKLCTNRMVRKKLKGIRAREIFVDDEFTPKPVEQTFKVRDFMSDKGIRDNERLKKEYDREIEKRQREMEAQQNGGAVPQFIDNTRYDSDGSMPFAGSHKDYFV